MPSGGYLSSGRVSQKLRTREVLIKAAADLLADNREVSISAVSAITNVGRTTIYRYFPTTDALIANAALWRVAGPDQAKIEDEVRLAATPQERVDALVVDNDQSINRHSREFRAMLRVSLDSGNAVERRGRVRYFAFKRALETLEKRLGKHDFERLICALSLTVGIEAQVVLEDICHLTATDARMVKRWAATSLLEAALRDEKIRHKVRTKGADTK